MTFRLELPACGAVLWALPCRLIPFHCDLEALEHLPLWVSYYMVTFTVPTAFLLGLSLLVACYQDGLVGVPRRLQFCGSCGVCPFPGAPVSLRVHGGSRLRPIFAQAGFYFVISSIPEECGSGWRRVAVDPGPWGTCFGAPGERSLGGGRPGPSGADGRPAGPLDLGPGLLQQRPRLLV